MRGRAPTVHWDDTLGVDYETQWEPGRGIVARALHATWAPREVPYADFVKAVAKAYDWTEAQADHEIRRQQNEADEPQRERLAGEMAALRWMDDAHDYGGDR